MLENTDIPKKEDIFSDEHSLAHHCAKASRRHLKLDKLISEWNRLKNPDAPIYSPMPKSNMSTALAVIIKYPPFPPYPKYKDSDEIE